MKKIVVLTLLIITMCVNFIFADDVSRPSDWAKADVEKAKIANIATGKILDNYTQNITRGEFCELIVNAYIALDKEVPETISSPFVDTKNINVSIAYILGIVNGVSEKEFAPDKNITREEMAVMMERMAKICGDTGTKTDIKNFVDYEQVSDWATAAIEFMVGTNIMYGVGDNIIAPGINTTREQAIVFIWRLYKYLGGEDIILKEDTSREILTDLNIIDTDKLNSSETITVYDAFVAMDKARGFYTEKIGDLSDWYIGETLAELDYLEDSKKALLLRLNSRGRNHVLQYHEIADVKLDSKLTNYEMLLYILRMVGDTYGCTDSAIGYLGTEKEYVYKTAYEKGLISSLNISNAESPVTYREFCDVLYTALYVGYSTGGYSGSKIVRLIDYLLNTETDTDTEDVWHNEEKVKISVKSHINDDLSISWSLPKKYSFIYEEKYLTHVDMVTKYGEIIPGRVYGTTLTTLDTDDIVRELVKNETVKITAIRCTYSDPDVEKDYYFDVDISNVKLVIEGEQVKPGKYIKIRGKWPAKELSLAESENFEEGYSYVLKGYDKTYRKDEYNGIDFECFRAEKTEKSFVAPANRSFGVSYHDEIHIQKVKITGNAEKGFVLSVTPESTDSFLIEDIN